jgi:hypothetical protein
LINDSTSSADSPPSKARAIWWEAGLVAVLAGLLIAVAAQWFYARGYVLYYGDAQAHLSISRGIIDSRTPGYEQIGSVWLPVLHLLCLPMVRNDFLWSSGLAGTIPVAFCFVAATLFIFLAAQEAYGQPLPSLVTTACFAFNPNLLYLGSIPMTEVVFLAGVSAQLYALLRFRRTQEMGMVALAGAASVWASLTRYDGWFLIPFVALGFLWFARTSRLRTAFLFSVIAVLAPLYWLIHNVWSTGDMLSFYHGPYSAKGIYERDLAAGAKRYPGDHNWRLAILYYLTAGRFCTGWPLMAIGVAGFLVCVKERKFAPIAFLALIPCFYIWSMYSSGTPIFIPSRWPHSYYNSRYGIALLPLLAFSAGGIVLVLPKRWRLAGCCLPLIAILPWLLHPSKENWICWKESQQNSESRRFWTREVAEFLRQNYQTGQGILFSHGDVPGVFGRALIPLRETLNPGNGPAYLVNAFRPNLVHTCEWAVVLISSADPLARAIDKANWRKTVYEPVLEIHTKNDPVVRLYRRAW